jgi:tetratricopeptide (TPR) repeat protein
MKNSSISALCSLLCTVLLAACSSPGPQFSSNPAINRHLEDGSRHYHAGRLREAHAAFEAAVAAADRLDHSAALVDAWMAKAATELVQENDAGARASLVQLRPALAVGSADLFKLDQSLALCAVANKDLAESMALLQPWMARIADLPLDMRAVLLANMAGVQLEQGQTHAALALAQDALALDRQLEHPPAIAADHLLLARVWQRIGQGDACCCTLSPKRCQNASFLFHLSLWCMSGKRW